MMLQAMAAPVDGTNDAVLMIVVMVLINFVPNRNFEFRSFRARNGYMKLAKNGNGPPQLTSTDTLVSS